MKTMNWYACAVFVLILADYYLLSSAHGYQEEAVHYHDRQQQVAALLRRYESVMLIFNLLNVLIPVFLIATWLWLHFRGKKPAD